MLKKAKSAVKSLLRTALVLRRERYRLRAELKKSRELVKSHPEWTPLTAQEKSGLMDKNFWQHTAFKNVYGRFAEGFVSDYLYHDILQVLNSINYTGTAFRKSVVNHNLFNNKNYYQILLKYLPLPKTVIMYINGELLDSDFRLITKDAALQKMQAFPQLVFKPAAGTGHGKNVSLVDRKDYSDAMNQYADILSGGGGYIVQEVLRQHDSFSRFNASSVNVLRITTLFWKSELYVLGAILRIGAPGQFCDHTTSPENNHPRIIALDNDGRLTGKFIDPDLAYI